LKLLLAKLVWREETVPLDQPGYVVGLAELQQWDCHVSNPKEKCCPGEA
jgi:hypothetical protein